MIVEELFAPLLWRLPVEAACRYFGEPEHPGWTPCLAGHRLLAEDVMGLRYDPVRNALKEADLLAAQVPDDNAEDGHEEDRALHLIYRQLFMRAAPASARTRLPFCFGIRNCGRTGTGRENWRIWSAKTHDKAKNLMADRLNFRLGSVEG